MACNSVLLNHVNCLNVAYKYCTMKEHKRLPNIHLISHEGFLYHDPSWIHTSMQSRHWRPSFYIIFCLPTSSFVQSPYCCQYWSASSAFIFTSSPALPDPCAILNTSSSLETRTVPQNNLPAVSSKAKWTTRWGLGIGDSLWLKSGGCGRNWRLFEEDGWPKEAYRRMYPFLVVRSPSISG